MLRILAPRDSPGGVHVMTSLPQPWFFLAESFMFVQLASGSAMARSQQRSWVRALRYSASDSILMEWVLATLAMMISDRSDRTAES